MLTRKMKDSGIEWIGEIPEDWDVVQVKHLFEIGRGRVISKEELKFDSQTGYPVYSSQTKNDGVLGFIRTYDFDQPQLTWTTDGANAGTVFLRKGKYNCTNVCGTLKLKSDIQDKISLDYVYHALYVGAPYYKRKDTNGYKIMNNEMAVIKISLPSFDIQKKISKEIEGKIKTINNLIIKTEQSIEELKKYKQSLITEAVTKGIDPNVEMKDSGIEWIGEIPGHWNFVKLGNISTKIGSGKTPRGGEDVYSQTGIYFLRSQNIYNEGLSLDTVRYITNDIHDEMSNTKVQHKDILLNITGGSIGRATIYDLIEEANVNQHVCIIRPNQDLVSSEWIHYCLISFLGKHYVNYFQTGGNREGLNFGEIAKFRIPLPKIEEQKIVSKRLKEQTTRIDKLIEDKTKVIEELEDYKKSLIYEYVTGKKEV